VGLPRNVAWSFTPASTGLHRVYAKWPAAATHTTEAKFTVAHAGGSTDVTVNQRINGGTWMLLGSFAMNAATAYSITLPDNANGAVAADAVRVVPDSAPTDKFTWTPTIPSSGSYDVYARWVAASANTSAASYSITHAGGTSAVAVSQKQNGGQWVKLGTYSFTPSAGHKVELLGSYDGRVVADSIRLVAAGAGASNLVYIHADHLGSPQKMTDASQALVWDAQFDPFGEEVSIAGSATHPTRFPGQYADPETGFSYNYFRDYDPTLGRYIQSDPIGLWGGLNTYGYVAGNPIARIDPNGQFAVCPPGESDTNQDGNCTVTEGGGGGGRIGGGGGGPNPFVILWEEIFGGDESPPEPVNDNATRQQEYEAYKRRCNESPPEGLNLCEKARWRLQRNKDCRRMRQQWDDKWQPGRHRRDIENLDRGIKDLEEWIRNNCCGS
jgi:RHS repeat-associated protein